MSVLLAFADLPLGPLGLCWYCGAPTDGLPLVGWWGADGAAIALHAPCAERLAVHLLGDVREAALASRTPSWPRRAARALGAALRAQEARP